MEGCSFLLAAQKAFYSILPAIAGSIGGAVFVILPQTKSGWFATLSVGVACGIYLFGVPLAVYPALGESGARMVAAWLGVVTLRTAGFAISKTKVGDILGIARKNLENLEKKNDH